MDSSEQCATYSVRFVIGRSSIRHSTSDTMALVTLSLGILFRVWHDGESGKVHTELRRQQSANLSDIPFNTLI